MTDRRRTATGGFTLVELLVVIAIIAILAAVIIPSVNAGFRAAKQAKAMGQVKDLQEACHRYYAEYNRAPVPAGTKMGKGMDKMYERDPDSNASVVDILVLADNLEELSTVNPKQIRFLDMDVKGQEAYEKAKRYDDPWGNPYQILLDLSYDDRIQVTGVNGGEIKAKVAVRSAGEDGEWDTKDDIKTW